MRRISKLISSKFHTKNWRKTQLWYNTGKQNECEIFQLETIQNITRNEIKKTDLRFNTECMTLHNNKYPNVMTNGFEYTEDFDGYQYLNDKHVYYNLKMVCDKGGSQTRTLREVYNFIRCQLDFLLSKNNYINKLNRSNNSTNNDDKYPNIKTNTHFLNILDGDECYRTRDKFLYLLNKPKYKSIKDRVFIGDTLEFKESYSKNKLL